MSESGKANDLLAQIPGTEKGLPPVHLWNPDFCGDIDMRIVIFWSLRWKRSASRSTTHRLSR